MHLNSALVIITTIAHRLLLNNWSWITEYKPFKQPSVSAVGVKGQGHICYVSFSSLSVIVWSPVWRTTSPSLPICVIMCRHRDGLLAWIQANEHHVQQQLLPSRTCHKHRIRSRRHNYTLNIKTDYDNCNFISRLLYKDVYWHCLIRFSPIFHIV